MAAVKASGDGALAAAGELGAPPPPQGSEYTKLIVSSGPGASLPVPRCVPPLDSHSPGGYTPGDQLSVQERRQVSNRAMVEECVCLCGTLSCFQCSPPRTENSR